MNLRALTHGAACCGASTLLGLAALLGMAPSASAAARTGAQAPVTLDSVAEAMGLRSVPISYILLVDTSGSMVDGNLYGEIRAELPTLLGSMSPADKVAIDTFDDYPQGIKSLGPVGDPVADTDLLPPAPNPVGNTDTGSALRFAYNQLELEQPAPEVAVVLLLTDGKPDVPASLHSKYYLSGITTSSTPEQDAQAIAGSQAWQGLGTDFSGLSRRGTTVVGAGLPLRAGVDLKPVIDPVFSDNIIDTNKDAFALDVFIKAAQEKALATEASPLASADSGKGVTATLSPPDAMPDWSALPLGTGIVKATVTLTSQTSKVPLTVTGPHLADGGSLGASISGLPSEIDLKPGQSVRFPVELSWPVPSAGNWTGAAVSRTGQFTLAGTVTSPWTAEITTQLDKNYQPSGLSSARITAVGTEPGQLQVIWWLYVVLAIVIVIAGALIVRRAVKAYLHPEMTGTLYVWVESNKPQALALHGREMKETVILGEPGRRERARVTVRGVRRREDEKPALWIVCEPESGKRDEGPCRLGAARILSGHWEFAHVVTPTTEGVAAKVGSR